VAKVLHCGGHVALTADKAKRWPTHTNTHWHTRTSWLTNARSLGKGKVNWQSRIRWKKGVLVLRCSLFPVIPPSIFPTVPYCFVLARQSTSQLSTGKAKRFCVLSAATFIYLLFCRLRCVSVCGSPFTFHPFVASFDLLWWLPPGHCSNCC